MKKPMLLAYAMNRGLLMITEEDARRMTHVNLAFGVLKNGVLSLAGLPDIGRIAQLRAFNPDIRIVLSVGGWEADGFSEMAMEKESRRAFVTSVEEAMDTHRLDGVDIDWEYPTNGVAGISHDPRDRENFTYLMEDLRQMAGERIVSIAAGAGDYFLEGTQMDLVARQLDYVQLMTYDMRCGGYYQAGHHTALYTAKGDADDVSTDSTVRSFAAAGVPKEKMVIGAAFYSRKWQGVAAGDSHGLLQSAKTTGGYGSRYSDLVLSYINKNGFTRYWDDTAKAPYLYNGDVFLSYDDPESLAAKTAYAKEQGLAGMMYWEHACDDTHTLLRALSEGLHG